MNAINRPDIEKMWDNITELLRNGRYTVYDAIRATYVKVNAVIDWLTDAAATLKANEDERIEAEGLRASAEEERVLEENRRVNAESARAEEFAEWGADVDASIYVINVTKASNKVTLDCTANDDSHTFADIPAATTEKAGVMTADDKSKLATLWGNAPDIVVTPDETKAVIELESPGSGVSSHYVPAATTEKAGVMTAEDKTKLNAIPSADKLNAAVKVISTIGSGQNNVRLSLTKISGSASVTLPNAAREAAGVITNVEWLALRALMRNTTMADYLTKRTTGWSVSLTRGEAADVPIPTLQTGEKLYVRVTTSNQRYNAIVLTKTATGSSPSAFQASAYCDSSEWQEVTGLDASGVDVAIAARTATDEETYADALVHNALDTLALNRTVDALQFLIAE